MESFHIFDSKETQTHIYTHISKARTAIKIKNTQSLLRYHSRHHHHCPCLDILSHISLQQQLLLPTIILLYLTHWFALKKQTTFSHTHPFTHHPSFFLFHHYHPSQISSPWSPFAYSPKSYPSLNTVSQLNWSKKQSYTTRRTYWNQTNINLHCSTIGITISTYFNHTHPHIQRQNCAYCWSFAAKLHSSHTRSC